LRSGHARLDPAWRRHVPPAWLEGWSPVRFGLVGGDTEVVAMGAGPPLLLLPPLPGWKEAWVACAARLSRRFGVVTLDLRAGAADWDSLLDDLDRVADVFIGRRTVVVGHSLGGALALRWALRRPERVAALVLSSAFARVTTPRGDRGARFVAQPLVLASQRWLPERLALPLARALAARGAWVYDPLCGDDVLRFVRCGIRSVPLALAAERVRLALAHDLRAALPAIACPTLVVHGERESRFVRDAAAELVRVIPGAAGRVSPGAGHLHPLSNAAWLCATLEDWLGPLVAG